MIKKWQIMGMPEDKWIANWGCIYEFTGCYYERFDFVGCFLFSLLWR